MRLDRTRWVLILSLTAILPLVIIGILLVQRLTALNEERYVQEIVAARYAAELTADDIRDGLREHFRPWRESLTHAHTLGEEQFNAKLRKMYFTSPLVDVPQFIDATALTSASEAELAGWGEEHRCEKIVALALRQALVREGRSRMGFDPATKSFERSALSDDEAKMTYPMRWITVDLDGALAGGCVGCEHELGKLGAQVDERHYALLVFVIPLPGGPGMQPGMFGAVVPAERLLAEVVGPALRRWRAGSDALPRHGMRVVGSGAKMIAPTGLSAEDPTLRALTHAEALHSSKLLGAGAPWSLEVVALSGFDAAQVQAENGRWALLIALGALALTTGAVIFGRSFLHQSENARLRRHLLSNVGHELKTPLSLIRLYTETLETGRARGDADRKKFLGIIGREAKRLTHLIDNLLDVQRIEEERKHYSFAQVRPDRVVRQTVDAYRFQLTEEGFDLRLDVDEELPLVHIDEDAIAQAVINLLDNASKYSDTVKEIQVRVSGGPDDARISVRDRGVGIPAREQSKIFESFYRVEKSDVHDVKGSGLGLAVVAHVAKAHGGSVEVSSTPGRGSVFTIILPKNFEPSSS